MDARENENNNENINKNITDTESTINTDTKTKKKEEKKGGNKMQKEKKSRKKQLTERIGIGVAIVVLIVVCIVAKSASSRYANTLPDLSKEKTVYEDKNVGELFNKVEKIIDHKYKDGVTKKNKDKYVATLEENFETLKKNKNIKDYTVLKDQNMVEVELNNGMTYYYTF